MQKLTHIKTHIIVKFYNTRNKEKVLQTFREKETKQDKYKRFVALLSNNDRCLNEQYLQNSEEKLFSTRIPYQIINEV